MRYNCITVTYNENTDETRVKTSSVFNGSDYVTKIDILQDAIHELEVMKDKYILDSSEQFKEKSESRQNTAN